MWPTFDQDLTNPLHIPIRWRFLLGVNEVHALYVSQMLPNKRKAKG